jgi:hypothetical protein
VNTQEGLLPSHWASTGQRCLRCCSHCSLSTEENECSTLTDYRQSYSLPINNGDKNGNFVSSYSFLLYFQIVNNEQGIKTQGKKNMEYFWSFSKSLKEQSLLSDSQFPLKVLGYLDKVGTIFYYLNVKKF